MIKDLKDLQKLLKLCRVQGVTEITLDTVHIKLGELPVAKETYDTQDDPIGEDQRYSNFPQGIMTNEQLAYYSAGGDPDADPENMS